MILVLCFVGSLKACFYNQKVPRTQSRPCSWDGNVTIGCLRLVHLMSLWGQGKLSFRLNGWVEVCSCRDFSVDSLSLSFGWSSCRLRLNSEVVQIRSEKNTRLFSYQLLCPRAARCLQGPVCCVKATDCLSVILNIPESSAAQSLLWFLKRSAAFTDRGGFHVAFRGSGFLRPGAFEDSRSLERL